MLINYQSTLIYCNLKLMECCEVFKAFGLLRLFNVCFSLSISCKVINLNTNIVFEESILQSKIVSDFIMRKLFTFHCLSHAERIVCTLWSLKERYLSNKLFLKVNFNFLFNIIFIKCNKTVHWRILLEKVK